MRLSEYDLVRPQLTFVRRSGTGVEGCQVEEAKVSRIGPPKRVTLPQNALGGMRECVRPPPAHGIDKRYLGVALHA